MSYLENLFFISGLPRSGSTLLANLIGQNPGNHVTPTNDLVELIVGLQESWVSCESFRAQGVEKLVPRISNSIKGLISGFYKEEIESNKTIFDKSRGWLKHIELMEEILERPIKIIVTIRDIRDMVASLEKIHRDNPLTKPRVSLEHKLNSQTIMDRTKQYLAQDALLGNCICSIKDVFEKGLNNRLIIVPYHELISNPQEVVSKIHRDCGLPDFQCSSEVKKVTYENDEVYGLPFHKLRDTVDNTAVGRWRGILTEEVADWLDSEYVSIQNLAHGKYTSY